MNTYQTKYITKTEIIRKLVMAWQNSDLQFPEWNQHQFERLAEITIEALNKCA